MLEPLLGRFLYWSELQRSSLTVFGDLCNDGELSAMDDDSGVRVFYAALTGEILCADSWVELIQKALDSVNKGEG